MPATRIATPDGEATVEDLAVGQLILTLDGDPVPVKWVGRKKVSTRFRRPDRLELICIEKGALGAGVPLRDLTVTADHAILIDGVLVQVGALANGQTIRAMTARQVPDRIRELGSTAFRRPSVGLRLGPRPGDGPWRSWRRAGRWNRRWRSGCGLSWGWGAPQAWAESCLMGVKWLQSGLTDGLPFECSIRIRSNAKNFPRLTPRIAVELNRPIMSSGFGHD